MDPFSGMGCAPCTDSSDRTEIVAGRHTSDLQQCDRCTGKTVSVSASLLWSCRNGQYESTGSLRGDRLAPVSGGAGSRLSGRKRKPDVSGDSDGGIGSASDDHRSRSRSYRIPLFLFLFSGSLDPGTCGEGNGWNTETGNGGNDRWSRCSWRHPADRRLCTGRKRASTGRNGSFTVERSARTESGRLPI